MIILVVWLVLLAALSLSPVTTTPDRIPHFDKAVHFAAYGVTTLIVYRAMRRWSSPLASMALAVLIAVSYGAALEYLQSFSKWRIFSYGDIAANAAGALVFAAAAFCRERR